VKPNLFIGCTFESKGGLQLIDYAILKHAEGNWLSNFYGSDESCDLRIRNIPTYRPRALLGYFATEREKQKERFMSPFLQKKKHTRLKSKVPEKQSCHYPENSFSIKVLT